MGSIISSKVRDDGKVVFEVCVNEQEALQLKGHINNIHIFSENNVDIETNVAKRGKREATMYLLIPKELRKALKARKKVYCQKIENNAKTIFIFKIDNYGL